MGAPDLLRHLREAGFTVAPADGGGIRVCPSASLTDAHRQAIRDHRAELLSLLARPPDPERWCWPHSDAMNGAELQQFANRAQQFTRRGITADAEAMADRLVIRDREQDDRRACLECNAYRRGRCGNHRRAGLQTSEVGGDFAEHLQRCPAFIEMPVTQTKETDRSALSASARPPPSAAGRARPASLIDQLQRGPQFRPALSPTTDTARKKQ